MWFAVYSVRRDKIMQKCTDSKRGTYNHECGKPATWIAIKDSGFRAYRCDACKDHGHENANVLRFDPIRISDIITCG